MYDVKFLYYQLVKLGSKILFELIQSHVGILGNEIADHTTNVSLKKCTIVCHILIYMKDIKYLTK